MFDVIQILAKFVTTDAEQKNSILSFYVGNQRTKCQHRHTHSLSIVPWNNFGKCFCCSKSKVQRGKETVDITCNTATVRQCNKRFAESRSTSRSSCVKVEKVLQKKKLLLVADASIIWAEIIFRIKWQFFTRKITQDESRHWLKTFVVNLSDIFPSAWFPVSYAKCFIKNFMNVCEDWPFFCCLLTG